MESRWNLPVLLMLQRDRDNARSVGAFLSLYPIFDMQLLATEEFHEVPLSRIRICRVVDSAVELPI